VGVTQLGLPRGLTVPATGVKSLPFSPEIAKARILRVHPSEKERKKAEMKKGRRIQAPKPPTPHAHHPTA